MRDVIVVGAGGGGPVVAKELAARGLDVLLLEAGPRFAEPRKEWTHFEHDADGPVSGFFRWGPSQRGDSPWSRELPQNCFVWQDAGVGGTTQHYFANSPRALPGVFAGYDGADRDAYDTAHRFPFSYRELVPYYEWVEETLPVQTAPMGTKEEAFFRGAAALGLPVQRSKTTTRDSYRAQENAILQPGGFAGRTDDPRLSQFPLSSGCTFCGHCAQGCIEPLRAPRNLVAKRSTDASYVPMALTADRWSRGGRAATLVTDAFVVRIETEERGGRRVARGVTWKSPATGVATTEDARVVVLAGGAIETPRLWLNSGLPNQNGWVGRGLTDHYLDLVVGVMPFETNSSKGPASAARADFPGRGGLENFGVPPALQAFSLTMSDSGIAGAYDNGRGDTGGADSVGRLIGPALAHVTGNLDRLLNVIVLTDDHVDDANRVELSGLFPPDVGGPVPRVTVKGAIRLTRTWENREFLVRKAVALVRAAGAREVYRAGSAPTLLHIHSTMRMGADPGASVLDEWCEARPVDRLFVADNSVLANALGGPNPTLTTQALATRTSERIFRRYFAGDPWVRAGEPVSSINPAVTNAVVERGI